MKILMVSHEYPPIGGGGANACMHLAAEYARAGHLVDVLTVAPPGDYSDEMYSRENTSASTGSHHGEASAQVRVIRLNAARHHLEHCSFFEMQDFLRKALTRADTLEKEKHYDICQIFFGIPAGPIGYRLKKRYALPYVIRFGGGDIPGFQARFQFVYRIIGPFLKIIWKNADALVANSAGLKKRAQSFYPSASVRVIPNGADADSHLGNRSSSLFSMPPEEHSDRSGNIHLLFVSRLIERKGLQDFLPYLKEMKQTLKEEGYQVDLTVVGDGPYGNDLRNMTRELELEDIVIFEGQRNKEELSKYYSAADIFLFPSRKEGMPNVVLEAMSFGLPVIMTPCEGSDELIKGNGYIAEAKMFPTCLMTLIKDDQLRKAMGARSLKLIREIYNWGNTAGSYLELFQEILISARQKAEGK